MDLQLTLQISVSVKLTILTGDLAIKILLIFLTIVYSKYVVDFHKAFIQYTIFLLVLL